MFFYSAVLFHRIRQDNMVDLQFFSLVRFCGELLIGEFLYHIPNVLLGDILWQTANYDRIVRRGINYEVTFVVEFLHLVA